MVILQRGEDVILGEPSPEVYEERTGSKCTYQRRIAVEKCFMERDIKDLVLYLINDSNLEERIKEELNVISVMKFPFNTFMMGFKSKYEENGELFLILHPNQNPQYDSLIVMRKGYNFIFRDEAVYSVDSIIEEIKEFLFVE